jgi:hypothetical protein
MLESQKLDMPVASSGQQIESKTMDNSAEFQKFESICNEWISLLLILKNQSSRNQSGRIDSARGIRHPACRASLMRQGESKHAESPMIRGS